MTGRKIRAGTTALALLLAIGLFPSCSDDNSTCPEPVQGTGLSSTVLAPRPRPSYYGRLFSPGSQDLFITAYRGQVLRRRQFSWTTYHTGVGSSISGIWGPSAGDVFAVGGSGAISRFDGASWRTMSSGTFSYLAAVHGTSADDVWAVGDGTVVHFDGAGWSAVIDSTIRVDRDYDDIWCAPTGEVFVLSNGYQNHTVLTYDGVSTWTELWGSDISLWTIWGTDPNNLWVSDDYGRIYQFDGTTWTHVHTMPGYVKSIHGTAVNDVWAVSGRELYVGGPIGDVAHFDGSSWSSVGPAGVIANYNDVQAVGQNEVYVLANGSMFLGWDGSGWRVLNDAWVTHRPFDAIWGSAGGGLWLLDDQITAWHTDGSNWEENYTGTTEELNAMWGVAENDIYAVGEGGMIVHYDGSRWSVVPHGLGTTELSDIWGTASNDIWVACLASYQMWHYDGADWTIEDVWDSTPFPAISLWGSERDDYYAVAGDGSRGGGVFHYDGVRWQQVSLDGYFATRVHGVSAAEVYFLTDDYFLGYNFLIRYTPEEHSTTVIDLGADLDCLWALGPDNVFVAGTRGLEPVVGYFDGSRLVTHTPDADCSIRDIWGSGSDTVYLCGTMGTLIRVRKN